VVVVDDDADVLATLVGSLRSLGYTTAAASSGPAALALIERHEPDAVIVDYAMPDMNGAEFIRELSARKPHLPVVLTSGQANLDQPEGVAVPALLRKPFRLDDLVAALTAAMGGGRR
jgi:CheY-like chemotaxis protein